MLSVQYMSPSFRVKLQAMSEDARATLEAAFIAGMSNPALCCLQRVYTRKFNGLTLEFYHVRIGYAFFVFMLPGNDPAVVWDADLQDGAPVYA
jgi:hypothetical protein